MTVLATPENPVTGEVIERDIPGLGLLRFENCDVGEWLTQKGEPAKKPRRRYLLNGDEMDSVSSVVDSLSKPALIRWAEDHGVRGGVRAERMGELVDVPEEEWVKRVDVLKLGATAIKDEGADRGHAIHAAFEMLARHGQVPKPSDYPEAWRPWVQGAVKAWMAMDPEPEVIETIVCNPEQGYAGRPDLIATVHGKRTLIDYKTGKGRVYDQAHYQTRGYDLALPFSDIEPVDAIVIVGVSDDGGFELVECEASADDWLALLLTFRSRKRINAGMAAQRKVARKAAT